MKYFHNSSFYNFPAASTISKHLFASPTSRGLTAGSIVQNKIPTNHLSYLFERFLDPAVKPREIGRGAGVIIYFLILILFLCGCAKQEHHYISQSKQLGFIEKTESFVFDQMDQNKIDEFKLFLEEFINAPFLRVKFYYPSRTPISFRKKIQHLLLKSGLKPKKIDFYKDIYLRDFLKVDLMTYTAILPICPDWSSPIPSTKENEKLSNLGCTQQTNLGLMLEDPYDLKESSSLTPGIASEKIDAFNDKNTQSREIENVWSDTKSYTK